MQKSFKKYLLKKVITFISIAFIFCTIVISFTITKSMINSTIIELNQLTSFSEYTISENIHSVKYSTDQFIDVLESTSLNSSNSLDNLNIQESELLLESLITNNPYIKRASIIDSNGMQIVKYPNTGYSDVKTRDYFQLAMKGESNFSEVVISSSTGQAVVTYCAPITLKNRIVGALATVLEVDSLNDSLNKILKDTSFSFALVDLKGSLLLTSENNSPFLTSDQHKQFFSTSSDNKELINLSTFKPIESIMQNLAGNTSYTFNKVPTQVSYRPIENQDLGLLIASPIASIVKNILPIILIIIGILIVLLIAINVVLSNILSNIINPIISFSESLTSIAEGNLLIELDSNLLHRKDEFGILAKNINQFINQIKNLLITLQSDTNTLADYAKNLNVILFEHKNKHRITSEMLNNVENKMISNSTSLDKVLNILDTFVEGSSHLTSNLNELNTVIQHATSSSEKGQEQLCSNQSTINESLKHVQHITEKMQCLNTLSDQIESFTTAISSIAEQTNLLALNAAIEAARSGVHGRGFHVVAEEVKKLALQCANSSKDITAALSNIHLEIQSTTQLVDAINKDFKHIHLSSNNSVDLMVEIATNSNNSQQAVEEITSVVEEQLASIDVSTESLRHVSSYVHETTNSSRELTTQLNDQAILLTSLSDISSSLDGMSKQLQNTLQSFKI